jgi:hypothetical protein
MRAAIFVFVVLVAFVADFVARDSNSWVVFAIALPVLAVAGVFLRGYQPSRRSERGEPPSA